MRTKTSVRMPSFFGPFVLSAGLLSVICFSEPFWQNFYVINAESLNTTMKVGSWGLCTKYRNTTGVVGPTTFCTSKTSGFNLNFVANATGGVNQFPLVQDEATLFGLNGDPSLTTVIFGSGKTGAFWLHPITAIMSVAVCATLVMPPSYFGADTKPLHQLQKSGMIPLILGIITAILALVTFCVDLATIIPAKNALNHITGIHATIGNIQWFALPCVILMIAAIVSVTMPATQNAYADL